MRDFILIGNENSKRTRYLRQAADPAACRFSCIDHGELYCRFDEFITEWKTTNPIIKIDPPEFQNSNISRFFLDDEAFGKYFDLLRLLGQLKFTFLNSPGMILLTLDKEKTKRILMEHSVPATGLIGADYHSAEEILSLPEPNIFIKPKSGSGASGVFALRKSRRSGKFCLYTSSRLSRDGLVNTKRIYKIENIEEIEKYLNAIVPLPHVVERWIPKDTFRGYAYDLRVVFQFGNVDYIVPRLSKSPITNLHLNNHAVLYGDLHLENKVREDIEELCVNAMKYFPGLNSAGIDILLTKNKKPMIIEINGQGDLIHQDIYNGNTIYKNQLKGIINGST